MDFYDTVTANRKLDEARRERDEAIAHALELQLRAERERDEAKRQRDSLRRQLHEQRPIGDGVTDDTEAIKAGARLKAGWRPTAMPLNVCSSCHRDDCSGAGLCREHRPSAVEAAPGVRSGRVIAVQSQYDPDDE
ncbi:MAG TPA: hypothetical protein VK607_10535 [Kofleriaceae bacterium]|nr:hypothetical protein [Kofleriaceae bacterium]